MRCIVLLSFIAVSGTALQAQVVQLADHITGNTVVQAAPGDTVRLDVRADFGRFAAAGVTVFVRVPAHGFEIVAGDPGVPFGRGPFFADAVVVRNHIIGDGSDVDVGRGHRLLEFSAVFGPRADRGRVGSGRIANLSLRCVDDRAGIVTVHHSPLHESRIFLADGRTEQRLLASAPVHIEVTTPSTATVAPSWGEVKGQRR